MGASSRSGAWQVVAALTVCLTLLGCGVDGEAETPAAETARVGEEVTVQGVVVDNTIVPCLFPQPEEVCEEGIGHLLHLDADAGHQVTVYYAGHQDEPCPNPEASEGAEQARVGTTVEVFAEVESVADDRVTLSVCGSPDFYVEAAN